MVQHASSNKEIQRKPIYPPTLPTCCNNVGKQADREATGGRPAAAGHSNNCSYFRGTSRARVNKHRYFARCTRTRAMTTCCLHTASIEWCHSITLDHRRHRHTTLPTFMMLLAGWSPSGSRSRRYDRPSMNEAISSHLNAHMVPPAPKLVDIPRAKQSSDRKSIKQSLPLVNEFPID